MPKGKNGSLQLSFPGLEIPDYIPKDAWQSWLEMRKAKKHPLTHGALKYALCKIATLREMGHDPGALLGEATLRGWAGIFPVAGVTEAKREQKPTSPIVKNVVSVEHQRVPMPDDVRAQMYRTFGKDITKTRH